MIARSSPWLAALVLAAGSSVYAAPVPASDPATAFKPTLTVRIAPPDQILADIRYAAGLIAHFAPTEQEGKQFVTGTETGLDRWLGTDWRKAIDTTRPLLGYVTLNANLPASTGAALIPVKDAAVFRKMVAALVGKVYDEPDGVLRFELPGHNNADGKPANGYVRFSHQYAYLTYKNPIAIALSRIPTPTQVVAGDPTAGVSFRLFMDRLPEQFRQQAVAGVQQFKAILSGGQGNAGMAMGPAWMDLMIFGAPLLQLYPMVEPAIRDAQVATLDIRFDRKHVNLSLEANITPRAGSELSKLAAAIKPTTSLFQQMLGEDFAVRGLMRGTIPESIRKAVIPQMEGGFAQLQQFEPIWGAMAAKIGESLLPTFRDGEIDLAYGLQGPGKGDRYGIVAALRLKDAPAVEKAFRDAVKALPKNDQAMFKLDAATVAGVTVHQILPPPLPATAKSIFGESTIYLAFRPDGVVAAFGNGAPGSLSSGLSAKAQTISHSFIDASGRKLVPLITKIDADVGKKFQAALGTEFDRIPLMDLAVEGGSTLKIRYGNGLTTFLPLMWFGMVRTIG